MNWLAQAAAVLAGLVTGRYERWADAGVEYVLDPTYLVAVGRTMMICFTLASGVMLYRFWRRRSYILGIIIGIAFTLSPLIVRSALRMPPEVLLCPLVIMAVTASVNASRGRISAEVVVGLLAGLLASTKLSALPMGAACILHCATTGTSGRSRFWRVVRSLGTAAIAFVVTTPFALLDLPGFARGVSFEWGHLQTGHLLGAPEQSIRAQWYQLTDAMGYALPVALIALPLVWRELNSASKLAAVGALTFLIPAMLSSSGGPERYVLPAVPLLWLVVAEVIFACRSIRGAASRLFAVALSALVLTQLLTMGRRTYFEAVRAPAAAAGSWLRSHASPDAVIVQERGATALPTKANQLELESSRSLAAASDRWRAAAHSAVWYSVVTLPFVASGDIAVSVPEAAGQAVTVEAFSPSWTIMPAVYQALHEVGAEFVVRTGSIAGRLGALYPRLGLGDSAGRGRRVRLVEYAGAGGGIREDQDVQIEFWETPPDSAPALRGEWWLSDGTFRVAQGQAMAMSPDVAQVTMAAAKKEVFGKWCEPFLLELARYAVLHGDMESAVRAARLVVLNLPDDNLAVRIAILGIAGCAGRGVPAGKGDLTLSRSSSEATDTWLRRVLVDWGVDADFARAEVVRYTNWHGK